MIARLLRPALLVVLTTAGILVASDNQRPLAVSGFTCVACGGGEIVGCASGSHKAWEDDDDAVYGGYGGTHEECRLASCSTAHGHCDIETNDLLASVDAAVAGADAAGIASFLSRKPNATFNASRSAIQVSGCRGELAANVPVPPALAAAVASAALAN